MTTANFTRAQLFQNRAYSTIRRPGVALELGNDHNLFTVAGGPVIIQYMFGHCTELIAGAAIPFLAHTPTGGALVPLCALAVNIDTDVANTIYGWSGLIAGVLTPSVQIGAQDMAATGLWAGGFIILVPGIISIDDATGAAVTGGLIDWYIQYLPLATTTTVTIL